VEPDGGRRRVAVRLRHVPEAGRVHKKSIHKREGQEKRKKQEARVLKVLEEADFAVHKQCHIKIENVALLCLEQFLLFCDLWLLRFIYALVMFLVLLIATASSVAPLACSLLALGSLELAFWP
jgi:hypothetical protein